MSKWTNNSGVILAIMNRDILVNAMLAITAATALPMKSGCLRLCVEIGV
jgi:hypothetical protein